MLVWQSVFVISVIPVYGVLHAPNNSLEANMATKGTNFTWKWLCCYPLKPDFNVLIGTQETDSDCLFSLDQMIYRENPIKKNDLFVTSPLLS